MKVQKSIALALMTLGVLPWFASANAQEWKPTKPVEFLVGAGPGGSLDQVARTLKNITDKQNSVSTTLIVKNQPAGGGALVMNTLEQHPGDAHYIASWAQQWLTNYVIGDSKVAPTEYTTLAILFSEYVGLAVRADSPIKNAGDLVKRLRAAPDSVSIAVATALGNHIHIGAVKPLLVAGIDVSKLTIVPFKSSADSLVSALGGHVDVIAATTPNFVTQLEAGKIRILAISSPERLGGAFAGVPTWKEQGVDAEFASYQGIMGPKNLTSEQQTYWTNTLRRATETPEWRTFVQRNQWKERLITGKDAAHLVDSELREMRSILRELNLAKQ